MDFYRPDPAEATKPPPGRRTSASTSRSGRVWTRNSRPGASTGERCYTDPCRVAPRVGGDRRCEMVLSEMLGDFPKVHPRSDAHHAAKLDLSNALFDIRRAHSLTASETFALLAEEMRLLAQSCVRSERERDEARLPDTD